MTVDINEILKHFNMDFSVREYGNGHINDTYISNPKKYIVQRINTNIFTNPDNLMENIENVTEFIRKKIILNGGDPSKETLTIIKTSDGKNYYKHDENNCFRMYNLIQDTVTIENEKNPKILYNAGIGFGRFQSLLDDYPAHTLHETIKDFHNTTKRVDALKEAIKTDSVGRAKSVEKEIDFALSHERIADIIVNGIKNKSIPTRVTHNDTKINNILFDDKTLEAVCVIDLDTIMPGSSLYDFGDALRMGASTAAEDETDLSKVEFEIDSFRAFLMGYWNEMHDKLTKSEIELLHIAPQLMTYECGIRFLTDYLNGDTYFKIHREHHNLDRARNQFRLVADMQEKLDDIKQIVCDITNI